jgi:hypothetical protein
MPVETNSSKTPWGFYQNIYDDNSIKTFFLKRIANDPDPNDAPFYDTLNIYAKSTGKMPKGLFLHTNDPDDLDALFRAIGKRIRLKLVR